MNKLIGFVFFMVVVCFHMGWAAEGLTALEVVQKVFDREDGDDSYSLVEMVLVDKNGNERKRILDVYTKDFGEKIKTFLEFNEPADIKGTRFLSWENEGKDDTQYLYLPALGRSRRIVSSQKNVRFVNTDFTYEDMQRRKPEKDEHFLLKEDNYYGYPCYLVESIPEKGSSQYSKWVTWVDKTCYVVLAVDFYNKKGENFKKFKVKSMKRIQGIWTSMETNMEDFKEKHKTFMKNIDVKYNQGIEDEKFSLRAIESN
ncbi:MAG: outer membrane lipoprotein-sorting protein [Candidatus Omnitrophica bacterium]|nr:outer membrane lipoprotein-sorting protein [Candidatus Omnitrophota bacterium]